MDASTIGNFTKPYSNVIVTNQSWVCPFATIEPYATLYRDTYQTLVSSDLPSTAFPRVTGHLEVLPRSILL